MEKQIGKPQRLQLTRNIDLPSFRSSLLLLTFLPLWWTQISCSMLQMVTSFKLFAYVFCNICGRERERQLSVFIFHRASSLGVAIPLEQLAAIRAKFMAKKRQTIRPTTVESTESAAQGNSAVDAALAAGTSSAAPQLPGAIADSATGAAALVISDGAAVPASSQPRVLSDAALTREYVITRERLAATRNSVLTTPLQLKVGTC